MYAQLGPKLLSRSPASPAQPQLVLKSYVNHGKP